MEMRGQGVGVGLDDCPQAITTPPTSHQVEKGAGGAVFRPDGDVKWSPTPHSPVGRAQVPQGSTALRVQYVLV